MLPWPRRASYRQRWIRSDAATLSFGLRGYVGNVLQFFATGWMRSW
jgi:hypothetical protein